MFKRFVPNAIAFVALALQTGCMTPVQQLDETAVRQHLRLGQAQEEVRRFLGSPKRTDAGSNGKKLDVFLAHFPKPNPAGTPLLAVRAVHVLYRGDGTVEQFTCSAGELKGRPVLRDEWQAGRRLEPEQIQKIRPGVTTVDELAQWFGTPTVNGLDVYGRTVGSWFFVAGRKSLVTSARELAVWFDTRSIVREFGMRDYRP